MQLLLHAFATKINPAQSMKLFTAPKSSRRSWTEPFLYLTAMSDACGGADHLVLDNIVHCAGPAMQMTMLSRLDLHRQDSLRQAEELAQFEQSMEIEVRVKHFSKDVVNMVEPPKIPRKIVPVKKRSDDGDARRCYTCGEPGHIEISCPKKPKKSQDPDYVLGINDSIPSVSCNWVLDSGLAVIESTMCVCFEMQSTVSTNDLRQRPMFVLSGSSRREVSTFVSKRWVFSRPSVSSMFTTHRI